MTSLDPPFDLPGDAPALARQLYDWLALVQDQVDSHSAMLSRNSSTLNQLGRKLMATQSDIDAVVTELNAAADEITARIDELETAVANGQQIDLSGLKAAADRLRDVVPDAPAEPTA